MRDQFFTETNGRQLLVGPSSMHVVCPPCMRGIVKYLRSHGLSISCLRVGFDGIEFATDPSALDVDYLEYGVYSDEEKYRARKRGYLDYAAGKAVGSFSTDSPRATAYALKNGRRAWLYANDGDRILLWADTAQKELDLEKVFFDEESIIELLEGTFEGETVFDPVTDVPLVRSRGLAPFAPAPYLDTGGLRFDGLYALPQKEYTAYLRFFPNGKVVGVNSIGDAASVIQWLDEEFENAGRYGVWGDNVDFTFPQNGEEIGVDFRGNVCDDGLELYWKPKKTSRKGRKGRFAFQPVPAETDAQGKRP